MNKHLFLIFSILVITTSFIQSPLQAKPTTMRSSMNGDSIEQTTSLIEQIQQAYTNQPTNSHKAQFISAVLDNTDGILEQKIVNVQALSRVINAQITLHTGLLWNDDQAQVDWLYEQKSKIDQRLSELQWQAKSFGYKATVKAAKLITIYLGIILAAYVAQEQFNKITGRKEFSPYGTLAWMPIEQILELAKNAILTITGPTTQNIVGSIVAATLAVGKTVGNLAYDAGSTITKNLASYTQKNLHETAIGIAKGTKPNQPTPSSQSPMPTPPKPQMSQPTHTEAKTVTPTNVNPAPAASSGPKTVVPAHTEPKAKPTQNVNIQPINQQIQPSSPQPPTQSNWTKYTKSIGQWWDNTTEPIEKWWSNTTDPVEQWWDNKKELGNQIDTMKQYIEQEKQKQAKLTSAQRQSKYIQKQLADEIEDLRKARYGIGWKPSID